MRAVRIHALLLGASLAAGCAQPPPPKPAPREWYVVMPEADGRVGTVVVTTPDGKQTVLHGAYASARLGDTASFVATEAEVQQTFARALDATPVRPATFTLLFRENRDDLSREAMAQLGVIVSEINRRPAPEVSIIGHADATSTHDINDALSARRAERVRATLVRMGVDAKIVEVAGKGKRLPVVPTPDNVAEQRNRRVEVDVR